MLWSEANDQYVWQTTLREHLNNILKFPQNVFFIAVLSFDLILPVKETQLQFWSNLAHSWHSLWFSWQHLTSLFTVNQRIHCEKEATRHVTRLRAEVSSFATGLIKRGYNQGLIGYWSPLWDSRVLNNALLWGSAAAARAIHPSRPGAGRHHHCRVLIGFLVQQSRRLSPRPDCSDSAESSQMTCFALAHLFSFFFFYY